MILQFATYLTNERRYSDGTVSNYVSDLEEFAQMMGVASDEDWLGVGRSTIQEWLKKLGESRTKYGRKQQPSTINRKLSSIKSFYTWLVRSKKITKNPTLGIHRLKTPMRLPSFATEDEMLCNMSQRDEVERPEESFVEVRNRLIIVLLYGLGLRRAELVGINLEDFSPKRDTLKVRGKGGKERIIPVLRYVAEQIEDYLQEISRSKICIKEKKALILSLKGERIAANTVYRIVRSELGRMGIKGKQSPHVLRHTFATHLMNRGGDMRNIQELMGHSSLRSTQVYVHNTISEIRKAYDRAHPRGARQKLTKTGAEVLHD